MDIVPKELLLPMPWGNVALKCWNSKTLPPMLIVHGSGLNAGSFDQLIPQLLPHYFYVCVDLPGHGRSDPLTPGLPLQFMHYVAVLQRITIKFHWDSYSMMGHSLGGLMVLFVAAARRTKVQRLIFLDLYIAPPVFTESYLDRAYADIRYLLDLENSQAQNETIRSSEDVLKNLMNRDCGLTSEEVARSLLARDFKEDADGLYSTTDPRRLLYVKPYISEEHLMYFCKHIICPVLVLLANESQLNAIYEISSFHKQAFKHLSETHPLSQIRRVQGSHSTHCENPRLTAKVINEFLHETRHLSSYESKL